MELSHAGIILLGKLEGREKQIYLDSGGAPTIGVGHLLTKGERMSGKLMVQGVVARWGDGLTDAQIDQLLEQDLRPVTRILTADVEAGVLMKQTQFDALCCFVFNVGVAAYKTSTLRRKLLAGEYDAIPGQFRRWVYDNGAVVQGLKNRREAEIALWES